MFFIRLFVILALLQQQLDRYLHEIKTQNLIILTKSARGKATIMTPGYPSDKSEIHSAEKIELTILMPCLNESETLGLCIDKALSFLAENNIVGEVLIADNGSTDDSIEIAIAHGARVVRVPVRGYGAALRQGIEASLGKYVIMGDSDDSYDFSRLNLFVEQLRAGNDLVMGNRRKGGIAPGAMPLSHKYLGNPLLSFIGRLFFKIPVGDFHCGLRGRESPVWQTSL